MISHPTSSANSRTEFPVAMPLPSSSHAASIGTDADVPPESSTNASAVGGGGDESTETLPPLARTKVWDVPFDCVTLDQAVDRIGQLIRAGRPSYVITANLNYVMLHHQVTEMDAVTREAALILADGQPVVWRSKLESQRLPERVAGSEMIYQLAQRASCEGWRVYFLGGEPGVAAAASESLVQLYPGLRVVGVESPPFRPLSQAEQAAQDHRIRSAGTDLLLVAFGQPKGERWIHQHHKRLGVPVSIQLGASFDFIAGTARRAPEIWQKLGLEWAYRMCSQPRRLVPRYAANACFLLGMLIEDWKLQVTRWGMGEWTRKDSRVP